MRKSPRLVAWMWAIFLFFVPLSSASSYTFYLEPMDGMVELEIRQPEVSLKRMYFNIPGQNKRFVVRVDRIDADVDWVYDYFMISSTGMQGEPESVAFDIRVNKSWVSDNNIDLKTIALGIYDEDWARLSVIPVSEDADFLHYRADPPKLEGLFALSGEPVLVDIRVTSPCNENDVCEPERGEDRENCPDCIRIVPGRCVPSEKYCVDDYLFRCSADGSEYSLGRCDFGCAGDACLLAGGGTSAGMAIALNPVFVSVLAVLLTVVIYLALLVKRMRNELLNVEEVKISHEDVKKIVKRKA